MVAGVNAAGDGRVVVDIGVVNDLSAPDFAVVVVKAGSRSEAALAMLELIELAFCETCDLIGNVRGFSIVSGVKLYLAEEVLFVVVVALARCGSTRRQRQMSCL